ncbi:MAG: hypothetical protein ACK5NT_06150 [Pyrinomonadaceae bacterium]
MRGVIKEYYKEFVELQSRQEKLLDKLEARSLFEDLGSEPSAGECIVRSVAVVEQVFGGITARLWDDPFEWTLPEELSTKKKIRNYILETSEIRDRAFDSFTNDLELTKIIPAPEELRSLSLVLTRSLVDANVNLERARIISSFIASY